MKESESEVLKRTRLMRRNGIVHRFEEHLDQLIDNLKSEFTNAADLSISVVRTHSHPNQGKQRRLGSQREEI